MVLNKIPSFSEVKTWVNGNTATSVNGETGDVTVTETPTGIISMWSGATSNVPDGWVLCDGNNGTPDLRDKFVTGAGSQYAVGDTGGEDKHTLTVGEMPSHNHRLQSAGLDGYQGTESSGNSNYSNDHTTDHTGGDEAHENRPPFYAVAYVMKL